ncbi:MAG TPA: ABC transporter substrate-binding protein [Vicinamibacterales bacterium]|nr:ABC transporter substrate-binding protein [Vicinamibacterales bacterium]
MTIARTVSLLGSVAVAAAVSLGCVAAPKRVLTISGSAVGAEGDVIRRQLDRFRQLHPASQVALRVAPDAADQRHQLYVQWLNGHAADPDVLQLDVVWTAEFAAAGWLAKLDRFHPPVDRFFATAVAAARWHNTLFALPWFVDVGTLYWRTDLMPRPPRDLADLTLLAKQAQNEGRVPYGFVWQGARYEGLVTVFLEYLSAFGGAILGDDGRVVVDSEAAVNALTGMRDAIYVDHVVPPAVLTWQEEQTRFAFQNGQAAFMRNWPYAYALMEDPAQSRVAGHFAVAPMPGGPGGRASGALGGSTLAINAFSDQPDEAYQLIDFLLQPEQVIERARVAGQFPSLRALYDDGALGHILQIPPAEAKRLIAAAVPRPVTPVYTELSAILQVSLHRALTRQQEPREALHDAASAMRALLARVHLDRDAW